MNSSTRKISCIILAGGEGKRAGGADKGLILYEGKPLIEHVIDSVKGQVDDIIISANRNTDLYKQYTVKVYIDESPGYCGPLAGIAACLSRCDHELILIVACDMPALPGNLVDRLVTGMRSNSISIATVGEHHQLAMLVQRDLVDSIQQQLDENQLKLIQWVKSVAFTPVSFDDTPGAFLNLNELSGSGR